MKKYLTPEYLFAPVVGVPIGVLIFYFYRLWMAPIPIEVFERYAEPLEVTTGTEVHVTWQEVRTAECRSVVYRQLLGTGGDIVVFEPMEVSVQPAGPVTGSFSFIMPEMSQSGPVTYRVKTEFFCNWAQELLGGPWLPLQDIHLSYTKGTSG